MARSNRNLQAIFQDTANAIRGKTGGSSSINPRDFADEIDSIPQDGGDEDFVERVANTLSRVNNSNVLSIGSYAFCSCNSLIEVSFPNCTRMSVGAFYGCSNYPRCRFTTQKKIPLSTINNLIVEDDFIPFVRYY